jgi:biopolymer transport protein ExbD
MAMNVGPSSGAEPDVMVDINTTPLIDVMLVLLIMLIITIPIQLHSVNLNMPVGSPPPPLTPPVIVTIDIDFDGTTTWNGDLVSSDADLDARLRAAAGNGEISTQPEIHLHPNKLVKYRYVAHVLAAAQKLGLRKIGIIGNEQFV